MAEKEYIEREKLLTELQEELDFENPIYNEEQNKWFTAGLKCAIRAVKRLRAADVLDVVLCKDCEHSEPIKEDDKMVYKPDTVICGRCYTSNDKRPPDWYCPMGERRKQK